MRCRIDGCERSAYYTGKELCQMHYFRFMRNGTYELVGRLDQNGEKINRKMRRSNVAGYQMLFDPSHPLSMSDGYVYEHRKIVFEKYGFELPDCELCAKAINWKTCHIDHIDRDVTNNSQINLRPLCRTCNTRRDVVDIHLYKGRFSITFDGLTMTPQQWARDSRVSVSGAAIRRRKSLGMSDFDALFSPKITHKNRRK